jgi:hypothetical protein
MMTVQLSPVGPINQLIKITILWTFPMLLP